MLLYCKQRNCYQCRAFLATNETESDDDKGSSDALLFSGWFVALSAEFMKIFSHQSEAIHPMMTKARKKIWSVKLSLEEDIWTWEVDGAALMRSSERRGLNTLRVVNTTLYLSKPASSSWLKYFFFHMFSIERFLNYAEYLELSNRRSLSRLTTMNKSSFAMISYQPPPREQTHRSPTPIALSDVSWFILCSSLGRHGNWKWTQIIGLCSSMELEGNRKFSFSRLIIESIYCWEILLISFNFLPPESSKVIWKLVMNDELWSGRFVKSEKSFAMKNVFQN